MKSNYMNSNLKKLGLIISLNLCICTSTSLANNTNKDEKIGDTYQYCLGVIKKQSKMDRNCYYPELHATDRGGANILEHNFQRVFFDIKNFINEFDPNLKYENLKDNEKQAISWLRQESNRIENISNINILREIQASNIKLFFTYKSLKFCNTENTEVPTLTALCFNYEKSVNIEISTPAVTYVMELDAYDREREIFTLLFHEMIHFAGNADHQFASTMSLEIYNIFKIWKSLKK